MQNRRNILAAMAGLLACAPAKAETETVTSPIAHGVLADNPLAKAFLPDDHRLPNIWLLGPHGKCRIRSLCGRTILMPIWAEWCPQCLSELPDFSRLQLKYSNDKFTIIPVLSGTQKKMTVEVIAKVFRTLHADGLLPMMEYNCGWKLFSSLAQRDNAYVLPCNLLIAPDGTVIAREFGRPPAKDADALPAPAKTRDAEIVTRAIHGQTQSLWGEPAGEAFAAAMAAGFLG